MHLLVYVTCILYACIYCAYPMYVCMLVHVLKSMECTVTHGIFVVFTALPTPIPPKIVAPPKSSVVIAPYSATFSCSASGSKISWKRQDGGLLPARAVTATQDTKIDEVTTTGFLIISDVTADDAGKYCCVVGDSEGTQVQSECAQLTVQSTTMCINVVFIKYLRCQMLLLITYRHFVHVYCHICNRLFNCDCLPLVPPPVISEQPEDVAVMQGTSVTLQCEAESYGDTIYQWQRVDGELDTSRSSGVNTKQLTIVNTVPSDSGSYVCITSNQDGETVSREAAVTVTGVK